MDRYRQMAVFATVVQFGSMSGAARHLGMTPSAVSQTVTAIERENGVRLLNRSTRKLGLTDIGQRYLLSCQKLLAAAQDAQNELTSALARPRGLLRIAAPLGLGAHIPAIFGPWLKGNPDLALWLDHSDAHTDLIEGRIDLAVRYGTLPDSSWYSRKVGTLQRGLFATPAWLQGQGLLDHPRQVPPQDWIVQSAGPEAPRPLLSTPEDSFLLPAGSRFSTNSHTTSLALCRAGQGVAILTDLDTAEDVARGQLVRVLPAWRAEPLAVWAISSRRETQPAKVSQAIDRLKAYFAG